MTLLPARDLQHFFLRIQNMQLILRIFQRSAPNHDFVDTYQV